MTKVVVDDCPQRENGYWGFSSKSLTSEPAATALVEIDGPNGVCRTTCRGSDIGACRSCDAGFFKIADTLDDYKAPCTQATKCRPGKYRTGGSAVSEGDCTQDCPEGTYSDDAWHIANARAWSYDCAPWPVGFLQSSVSD